jgi:hypothetical protein
MEGPKSCVLSDYNTGSGGDKATRKIQEWRKFSLRTCTTLTAYSLHGVISD